MILGIGNDIIEIERIRNSIERHGDRLLAKLFTEKELAYCFSYQDPVPRLAARFSAKEAVVKALGTGFGKLVGWHDLEILNNQEGKPEVGFSQLANEHFNSPKVLLSISHCELYATAFAIWLNPEL